MKHRKHRKEIKGEFRGVVHFHGADNQGHETLCGHSLNVTEFGPDRGPVQYADVDETVDCAVCLRAAAEVLGILGIGKARAARMVQKAAGSSS